MDRPDAKSFKHLTLSVERLPASMAQQERLTSYAAERARLLFGSFRTGNANDPETYVAAVTAVLARFPEGVITEVTHPVTGLPKQTDWLPTVKEVHDACEKAMEPIYRREREAKILADLKADREVEPDKSNRPTREELQAKYGPNWGLTSLDEKPKENTFKAPTKEQLAQHYATHNLGFQPKQEGQ